MENYYLLLCYTLTIHTLNYIEAIAHTEWKRLIPLTFVLCSLSLFHLLACSLLVERDFLCQILAANCLPCKQCVHIKYEAVKLMEKFAKNICIDTRNTGQDEAPKMCAPKGEQAKCQQGKFQRKY